MSPLTTAPGPPTPPNDTAPPVPPTATTWIEDTPAGTVNGFTPEVNSCMQVTICPDWLHPAGNAAADALALRPDAPTAAIAATSTSRHRNARSKLLPISPRLCLSMPPGLTRAYAVPRRPKPLSAAIPNP